VIGNGSSGIQIVAAMQPKVSKLVTYVRSPTWISVNFCADKAKDGKNFEVSKTNRGLAKTPWPFWSIAKSLRKRKSLGKTQKIDTNADFA